MTEFAYSKKLIDIEYSSEMTVNHVRHMAADEFVVQTAQVSAKGESEISELLTKYEAGKIDLDRFITALMKGRHGSPFEHNAFTFFVKVPIFVIREWQRHRMSSFNEMSGRYTVLPGEFYIPDENRKVINIGTKMKPKFEPHLQAIMDVQGILHHNSESAWEHYQWMLEAGIANEVARMVLPLNIYTQMYWTVNARSLMNFLSLRVESDDSLVRSYPQYEIDVAAQKVEAVFKQFMPKTHNAFVKNGRVAP